MQEQIKILQSQLEEMRTQLENSYYMTTAQRLACLVQKLCQSHKLSREEFTLPLTKTVLALRLGVYNETLSRTIPKVINLGLKITGSKVTINNPAKVKKAVCDNCSGQERCAAFKYFHEINQ